MSYIHVWGILATVTGIAATYSVIKNRKPASGILHGVYLTFSIIMVCLGITTIILEKYDSICAIFFGITFLKIAYNDRHTFPPDFTIDYIIPTSLLTCELRLQGIIKGQIIKI